MKICVFSDSHGYIDNMVAAIELEKPDMCFFLGDGERDITKVMEQYPDLPIYAVRGNCDFGLDYGSVLICEVDGVRIFLTHGHRSNVKYEQEPETLALQAIEAEAQIALFGHTHYQQLSNIRGVMTLNPGSIGRGYYPSYAVLTIENGHYYADLKSI